VREDNDQTGKYKKNYRRIRHLVSDRFDAVEQLLHKRFLRRGLDD
jgi:hypothetical protein